MVTPSQQVQNLEAIVSRIASIEPSQGLERTAYTLEKKRLHLARGPDGQVELFIEGLRQTFGDAPVGRALEFGEYVEVTDNRSFQALLIQSNATSDSVRLMAHIAYEAWRFLRENPEGSNEALLLSISPYLGLVTRRTLLSDTQHIGLVGELLCLEWLLNTAQEIGVEAIRAVERWTGWDSASRDFKGGARAVEVKATQGPTRTHRVHPIYQLLATPGENERVYVWSIGLRLDRSRKFNALTVLDRILARLAPDAKALLRSRVGQYGGDGLDLSQRAQYELVPGMFVTQPPALFRVDHLAEILRPEVFVEGREPSRARDMEYSVVLEGLPDLGEQESREVLIDLLRGSA